MPFAAVRRHALALLSALVWPKPCVGVAQLLGRLHRESIDGSFPLYSQSIMPCDFADIPFGRMNLFVPRMNRGAPARR